MKRRGFFGALLGLPAAAVLAKPEVIETDGVHWQPTCFNCHKLSPVEIFVPLNQPVGVGKQCPFCLAVYDLSPLAAQIRDYNLARGGK